ncbi:MAG: MarR family transcriptional regulator [Isosphaeraceae bacterium]|nr:MarR family transcriptional regulator [Isosphaeraceae bacterium]
MTAHALAMALRSAYLSMHRRTDAALAPLGITADQFVVLAALAESEPATQTELTARASADRNTLRAMLVLLERRGAIERRVDPVDRRARPVALTEVGRRILADAWRASEAIRAEMESSVGLDDLETLVPLLRRLAAAMDGDPAAALSRNAPDRTRRRD